MLLFLILVPLAAKLVPVIIVKGSGNFSSPAFGA
jgi:hypothetical protein